MKLLGYDLELTVETILDAQGCGEAPALFSARCEDGSTWLVARISFDIRDMAWLCVPVTERALEAVVKRGARPRDVASHSRTGTVELLRTSNGTAEPDRCLLSAALPESLLAAIPVAAALPAAA